MALIATVLGLTRERYVPTALAERTHRLVVADLVVITDASSLLNKALRSIFLISGQLLL